MATEITGYLMLERTEMTTLSSNRTIDYIISLDEGHDRPVWQWVKNSINRSKSAWVPEKPEFILFDGLLMIIADGLQDPSLKSQIDDLRTSGNALVDLQNYKLGASLRSSLGVSFSGMCVTVVAWPDSTLVRQLGILQELGIDSRLMLQRRTAI